MLGLGQNLTLECFKIDLLPFAFLIEQSFSGQLSTFSRKLSVEQYLANDNIANVLDDNILEP